MNALNLLQLTPGGHLGRFIIWTKAAFSKLDDLFGTGLAAAKLKKDYVLPQAVISNPDISRIINSEEIQSVVRPAGFKQLPAQGLKKNPLRNKAAMIKLNLHARIKPEIEKRQQRIKGRRVTFVNFMESIRE